MEKINLKTGNRVELIDIADSHIKSTLFGSSLSVIVENGRLALGTWQGIYFCENDGPRTREVWGKIA